MNADNGTHKNLAPAWALTAPLAVTHGEGAYLYTDDGRRYLDFACGFAVTSTGHCHPRVVKAAQEQTAQLIHISTTAHNRVMEKLAERLATLTPPGLEMMFFHSAGAEVIEAAIKLTRYVTGRTEIIAFEGGFHGRTTGAMALTTSKAFYRKRHAPFIPGIHFAPYAIPFRGGPDRETLRISPLTSEAGEAGAALARLDAMFHSIVEPSQVAAMIIEPILGEGGYIDPPPAFLQGLRRRCDEHGILLVADEIQSGVGRSGKWWAIEHAGVVPDLMTVAKGIASGFPLSVLVSKREIMAQWPAGAHGTTFGGNPVSCAAALATLEVIEAEGLIENSAERGEQLRAGLRALQADYPMIGDVRGKGLMTGAEFVKPDGSPNPEAVEAIKARCLENGVLISRCGPYQQTFRFAPPLIITAEQIDHFLAVFGAALDAVAES
ncbi:MAG: aspartate aminotransferase family protein [Anaerolineales bacterium]